VSIPDLAFYSQVSIKDRQSEAFRKKLIQLIEVEFDGQPAPNAIMDALQAYLANINIQFCTPDEYQTIRFDQDWQRLMETVNALADYQDEATNDFLVRTARKRLETIYLRFSNINNHKIEGQLIKLSRKLERLSIRNIDHQNQQKKVIKWKQLAEYLYTELNAIQSKSLYNIATIKQIVN